MNPALGAWACLLAALLMLGACGTADSTASSIGVSVVATQASGNRVLEGRLGVDDAPLLFQGPDDPVWLVAGLRDRRPVVVVVDGTGRVAAYDIDGEAEPIEVNLEALPPGTPPALLEGPGGVLVLSPPSTSGSFLTHPLALPGGGLVFVDQAGSLVLSTANGNRRLDIDLLPDARPVVSSEGLLAVYAGPSQEYGHGVLGDRIEARRIEIVDLASLEVAHSVSAPDGEVFEGLSPLWADVDADGVDELVATVSSPETGARIVVYSRTGSILGSSAPIGQGFRWRHQLAVGRFAPGGGIEIVDVRTPHLAGQLAFSALQDGELVPIVTAGTYRTHVLGSRNVDQAVAVQVDADGRLAMLVPTQDQRSIVLAERTDDGVSTRTIAEFDAPLATNITGTVVDGNALVAFALADGTVVVWR